MRPKYITPIQRPTAETANARCSIGESALAPTFYGPSNTVM